MKLKIVIVRRDHQNDARVIRGKQRDGQRIVISESEHYLIDDENFQITETGRWPFVRQYVTYYFREGEPKPIPIHTAEIPEEMRETRPDAAELASIFNPWFYRTIAPQKPSLRDQWGFILQVSSVLIGVYTVYLLTGLPDNVADAILAAEQAARQAAEQQAQQGRVPGQGGASGA